MRFRFYFFKEGSRVFDKADLFEFLNNHENINVDFNRVEKVAYYHNNKLDFDAEIILGEKSVVPNLHNLSPNFLDLNIRLEVKLLMPSYKLDKILDVIEVMCKRYSFLVYNETFEDVRPFKRSTMIKAYELIKQAYKEKNEEEFMGYHKLERSVLDQVYLYIENRDLLIEDSKNFHALNYRFYKKPGSRSAFVAVEWDGNGPFIMPSNASLFIYKDENETKVIAFKELFSKIGKYLNMIDTSIYGIYESNPKEIKKIKKILTKSKFTKLQVELLEVKLESILDL